MPFRNNIVIRATRRLARTLPASLRRTSVGVAALLFVNSLLELCGLATLIPLFSAVLESDISTVPYLGDLYDFLGMEQGPFVIFLAVSALLIFVAKGILSLLITRRLARFSFSTYEHFSTEMHRKLFRRGLQSMRSSSSHDITRDIDSATSMFAQQVVLPLLTLWNEAILLLIILLSMLAFEPTAVLLLAAVLIPTFMIFYRVVRHRIAAISERIYDAFARLRRDLYDSVFGYVDVVLCNRQDYFREKYREDVHDISKLSVAQHVYRMAPTRINEIAIVLAICVLVAYGVYQFPDRKELSFLLGVFALAAYRTLPCANRILSSVISIRAHEYLFDVIDLGADVEREASVEQTPVAFHDSIVLDDVSFTYDGESQPTLRGVDLVVRRGECVGVIGPSGSGKTTLLNLLLRFLIEDEGSVEVDGTRLTRSNVRAWRDLIGYVPQDVFLVEGTLAENIAFGRDALDRDRLDRALRMASLEDVVAGLPNGVDTGVGERGARLSGGQRQRIAIARALYAGAQILFFDEATSALDPATERDITDSILEMTQEGVTTFVVAHRMSTLRHCDRVIRLENGQVVAELRYEDLIAGEQAEWEGRAAPSTPESER